MSLNINKKQQKWAIIWSGIERISSQAISLVVSLIIARLLLPSDYGVIALLSIFIMVAQSLVDSGFSNALIQKKDRTNIDFSTVFYFNIVISLFMYCILYFGAIYIADFYDQPLLIPVTRLCALNIIIQGFAVIQRTKIKVELRFKDLTKVTIVGVVVSGITGILMASYGWGVYALLSQTLILNTMVTVGLWINTPWIPKKEFSWISFKQLFGFGSKLMIGGLLHTVYTNLYSLIIGKWYTLADLGLFTKANTLAKVPALQYVTVLDQVSYPVLCSLQNDDDEELEKTFFKYLRLACFVIFPVMIMIAVLSKPIILILLTEKWAGMIPFLQILCITYMFEPIQRYNWQLLNVKGRSDLSLQSEFIKKIVSLILLFGALPLGVEYICYGLLLYSIFDVMIIIVYVRKILPYGFKKEWNNLSPFFIASGVAGVITYILLIMLTNLWMQLILGGIIGGTVYIIICKMYSCPEFKYIKL